MLYAPEKPRQLGCSHLLNLVVAEDAVINTIIVGYFKQNVRAADALREKLDLKPIPNVATKWNSTLYMLQRFLVISENINDSLNILGSETPQMLNAIELLKFLY